MRRQAAPVPLLSLAIPSMEFHVKHWTCLSLGLSLLTGCAVSETGLNASPASLPLVSKMHPGEVVVPGSDLDLTGFLYRPVSRGRHPAMLQLHGCSGLRNATGMPNESYRFWAEHWVRLGFIVLVLDSFTPRGEKEICTQNARNIRVRG